MSWYGNHSTLSRIEPPAWLGIYRKNGTAATRAPQVPARPRSSVQSDFPKLLRLWVWEWEWECDSTESNRTELKTEQNWTALALKYFPHLMYQHISIYFISALGSFDANANRCANREEFIKPLVERSIAMHDKDDEDDADDDVERTSQGFLALVSGTRGT